MGLVTATPNPRRGCFLKLDAWTQKLELYTLCKSKDYNARAGDSLPVVESVGLTGATIREQAWEKQATY